MPRRKFKVIDIVEILEHWYSGRPISTIASSLGLDAKTIRKYIAQAKNEGIVPGGERIDRSFWIELVNRSFPEITSKNTRSKTFPIINTYHDTIADMVENNRVTTIYQRLRDENGLGVGITSFRQYMLQQFPSENLRNKVTFLREATIPGDEAQIDYGYLGKLLDPISNRNRKLWAFVMILTYSRYMYVEPVINLDSYAWIKCHINAFKFFGGVPRRLVIDNLKTGVSKPDRYDPKINRSYEEMSNYYGTLVDPARAFKPKDKAIVERQMPYIRESFYNGRTWLTLEQMQADCLLWCKNVAALRPIRALDKATPLSVFTDIEHIKLLPLPTRSFTISKWYNPKVGPDCYVSVEGILYSVHYQNIGKRLDVRVTGNLVEIFDEDKIIKTWKRLDSGRQTDNKDYPEEKIAFKMKTPMYCRNIAAELGKFVSQVVDTILEDGALYRLRSAQGIIGLKDKYDATRINNACLKAISYGDPTYKTIKGILKAGCETEEIEDYKSIDVPAHLHGPDTLFASQDERNV